MRAIMIAVGCVVVGLGFGYVQASMTYSGVEERFVTSRETLAERFDKVSREEILEQVKSGKPKLEVVGGTRHDFGIMKHGEELSHDFTFKNTGKGSLVLEMGSSTCKCTVGELDKTILEPNEETQVTLSWKALSPIRDFGQSAVIKTNDPFNLEVKLSVFGEIIQSMVVEPSTIQLGSLADSEETEKTFYVYSFLEDVDTLKNLRWTQGRYLDFVDFNVTKIDKADFAEKRYQHAASGFKVDVRFKEGMPGGKIDGFVTLDTNNENVKGLEVQFTGKVASILELYGGRSFNSNSNVLDIGSVDAQQGTKVSIFLMVSGALRDELIPEVVEVVPNESLQVSIGEARKQGSRLVYPINFEVPKGAPSANYPGQSKDSYGKVKIRTEGPRNDEIDVYVRVNVK